MSKPDSTFSYPHAPKRGAPMSEYQFARTFAFAWFRMNKIEMKDASTANRIAFSLGLEREGPGNGYAKKAIIEWHLKAITGSKSEPVAMEDFYSSQSWRKARYQALKNCNGKCTLCGDPPGKHSLHVDHIKPRSQRPDLALDPKNLQVLCRDCNLGKSNTDSIDWRSSRKTVDAEGEYSDFNIGNMLKDLH